MMVEWIDYAANNNGDDHTVVGNLKVLAGVESPQLNNQRDLLVY